MTCSSKLQNISEGAIDHEILYTNPLELQLETERRCFSKVMMIASKVTPNMARSSDSFRTVPSRVNVVDWGLIVCDRETIILLVLFAFSFIPERPHHLLTLLGSRFRDSATVTFFHQWMAQQQSKWSQHKHKACSSVRRKGPRCKGGTTAGRKLFPEALLTLH